MFYCSAIRTGSGHGHNQSREGQVVARQTPHGQSIRAVSLPVKKKEEEEEEEEEKKKKKKN